jgi:hypothetical protein
VGKLGRSEEGGYRLLALVDHYLLENEAKGAWLLVRNLLTELRVLAFLLSFRKEFQIQFI